MNQKNLRAFLIVMLFVFIALIFSDALFQGPERKIDRETYKSLTDFTELAKKGEVAAAEVSDFYIRWQSRADSKKWFEISIASGLAGDRIFLKELEEYNVRVSTKPPEESPILLRLLLMLLPMAFFLLFFLFLMSRVQNSFGGLNLKNFRGSPAQTSKVRERVTFADVAGCDEAKEEVKEIIDFLKGPEKFTAVGAKIPRGVLLVGSPGTGKTLLARAIAGEANVPFFGTSGSEFVEMFVGVGASRVRNLFEDAAKNSPAVVFIDELDAIGRHRGAGLGGGHDEREQTLNQILVSMDGFSTNQAVIVIAATNRPDILDPALTRPGRFDRHVVVNRPDLNGREEILKIHTRNIPLADDVNLHDIARGTPGFVGADLANLANEAALLAGRHGKAKAEKRDFEEARDKVTMGVAQRKLMNQKEKRTVAYHEAGHVLVAKMLPNTDPVNKVTIIPRGLALGTTHSLPEEDRHLHFKDYLLDEISVLYGGRGAEEILGVGITNGASNDIERATELARKMVCEWGMSGLGAITFGKTRHEVFLGRDFGEVKNYSEDTAKRIDNEIEKILKSRQELAKGILERNRAVLKALAESLFEKETLDGEEIDKIVGNLPPAI